MQALAQSRARSAALLKRFAVAVGTACLIAIVLAVWAMRQSKVAQANFLVAERETARANAEERKARESAQTANKLADEAKELQAQAIEAASVAKQALGKTWLATANAIANNKDRFTAHLQAARAIGFEGHGRNSLRKEMQDEFPVLLKEGTPSWLEAEKLITADAASQLLWMSGLRPQHSSPIVALARHPSQSLIASIANNDLGIQLWNTKSGEKRTTLETRIQSSPRASSALSAIGFSPDGKYFVAASDQIEIFRVESDGRFISIEGDLPQLPRSITSMTFSSDGKLLALGDSEGNLYVWEEWKSYGPFRPESTMIGVHDAAAINSLAFHPSNNRLLVLGGQRNGFVSLIDTVTHEIERLEPVDRQGNQNNRVHSLAFSPDGQLLAVAGECIPVTVWNVSERKPLTTLLDEEWNVVKNFAKDGSKSLRIVSPSIAFSADGSRLAVSWHHEAAGNEFLYYPNSATVFDLGQNAENPTRLTDIASDDGPFRHVVFDHQDDVLFLARAGRLESWDLNSGRPTRGEPAAHSARIQSLAFSRDGLLFASGDFYGFIRIWDARTGALRHTLQRHWGSIESLQFSADSTRLFATGFRDRMITAWDVSTGQLIEPPLDFENPIFGFDLTPDGKTLLAGGWYNKFFAYDPETLVRKNEIKIARGSAPFVLPDGKQVVALNNTSSSSMNLYEWQEDGSLALVNQWDPLHDSFWVDVAIHPDGKLMAVVFRDGSVKTFQRQLDRTWNESPQTMIPFRDKDITQLQFDPLGGHLITGTYGGETKIWDLSSEELLEVLPGNMPITSLVISPNGELLLTGNVTGMIHAWATQKKESEPVVVGTQTAPHPIRRGAHDIVFSPSRRLLFSTGASPNLDEVIAWRVDNGTLTRAYTLTGRKTQPGALALSSDERYLVSGPNVTDGELMLWDLETGESRQLARMLPASTLAFSPDGKTIAGAGLSGPDSLSRISLWDVAAGGDPVAETPLLPGPAVGIAFTADGTQLISAVATDGHPVQFWDMDPKTRALSIAKEFPTPPHRAMRLALNQAGTHLAVAFTRGGGWIWDLSKSSNSPSEIISEEGLFCFAFGPDDRLLATGGFFGQLRVFSSDAPREVIVSDKGGGLWNVVTDLEFDADGRTLFVSKTDGTITPWKLSGAKSKVPSVEYLRLFDLEEATGDLVWNDQNSKLSPPTATISFSPIQDHYLSELNVETDSAEPMVRLFDEHLSNDHFLAAEGLMLSMDPEVATGLREKLTTRLAEHLITLGSARKDLDCNLELASRLFEAYPDLFAVRLARCTQLQQWNQADQLLTHDLKKISVAERKRHVPHFFDALEAQIARLVDNAEPIGESDSNVPSKELVFASNLSELSRALDDQMAKDTVRGFSAEVNPPLSVTLLDRIAPKGWKTEAMLNDVLEMLEPADLGYVPFPWLAAFDEGLQHDQLDSPRLWRLRARIFEHLELYEQAFATVRSRLDALATIHSPAAIRESKSWLQWMRGLLEKTNGPAEELDAVIERFNSIPARPSGLDPKMIDLTDYYTTNLFGKLDLSRLAETFTPRHGVDFDLRGAMRLDSTWMEEPEKIEGIPVGQKSKAVHFLMGAQGGNKLGRIKVAQILVHFENGSTSTMTIKHKDHIADWLQWLDNFRLTDEQRGWSGNTANPWAPGVLACAISEVIWENPNPELTISHIDLVSEVTDVAPFVVAITLE